MSSNTPEVSLKSLIAPHFHELHRAIKNNQYDEYWLKGGRGSTKSSEVAIEIILDIMKDPEANSICFRKVGDTIRDSIYATLLWAIEELKVGDFFKSTVSPFEITYILTGQKIILRGLDKPAKIKSIKLRKGYFKHLWFEEASEYSGMEEIRSVEQSVLRGGGAHAKPIEFFSYNPPIDPNNWINTEVLKPAPRKFVHHSTYLTVPREWLGERFFAKAETLRKNNPSAYEHEYLGNSTGILDSIVFNGRWEIKEFNTPNYKDLWQGRFFFGADWGFARDPNVLIRCFIKDGCLWIDYEAFDRDYECLEEQGIKIRRKAAELEELSALFDEIPESRKWQIVADSARPETISYMRRQNFMIVSVKKMTKDKEAEDKGTAKGYVEDGITYMKGAFQKIYIHPRCKNLIVEFNRYSYEIDKNTNEVLPKLADAYNHGIDAIRYALSKYILKKVSIV